MGGGRAGGRGRDAGVLSWRPGKGRGVVGLAPGLRDAAISEATLAGCGRLRNGRVLGEWQNWDEGGTEVGRDRPGIVAGRGSVREMPGTSRFLRGSSDVTKT
jgi:hypothetical protein